MGDQKVRVLSVDDGVARIGVAKGVEHYDSDTGQLYEVAHVPLDELSDAVDAAEKEGRKRAKAQADAPGFEPRFDANDVRADSSPRSQDRPPIFISSESNPTEANPSPEAPADDFPRQPGGLAEVPGNTQFDEAPGPNVPPPTPKGVARPKPKRPSKGSTAVAKKAAADAKAKSDPAKAAADTAGQRSADTQAAEIEKVKGSESAGPKASSSTPSTRS